MSARSIRRSHERDAARKGRLVCRRAALATGAVAATAAITAPGAQAANFPVSNLNNAGANSLRGAILSANAAAGADSVTFTGAATSGEITLLTQIPITGDLTITGPGRQLSISGDADNDNVRDFATGDAVQGDTRIFNITDATSPGSPTQNVSISGLTLKEGVADYYDSGTAGQERESGGAILVTESNLTLTDVAMTDNVSTNVGGAVYLYADGPTTTAGKLTISNSTFTNNRALSAGGAIAGSGRKYGSPGDIEPGTEITNTVVSGNRAGGSNFGAFGTDSSPEGGGIITKYGPGLITGSTITGNTVQTGVAPSANGNGGGIYMGGGRIVGSVISGNTAGSGAGGVELHAAKLIGSTVSGNSVVTGIGGGVISTSKYLTEPKAIENSTISGNSAGGTTTYEGRGAGVAAYSYVGGVTKISNSTIAGNTATREAGGVITFRFSDEEPAVDLQSSIVADNIAAGTASDLAGVKADGMTQIPDPGAFQSGFSLIEAPGASLLKGSPSGSNLTGVDPQLAPLAANGGFTQTHALGLTSPAIDSGQANGFIADQRGSARPVESVATNAPLSDGTDIGAFEVQDASAVGGDPSTDFTKKPPKKAKLKGKAAKVTLQFSGVSNAGAPGPLEFECKVDKVDFVPCASPLKLKLAKGKHSIEVRAVDSAGRTDSTPAKAKIKVVKKKPKKK